MGMHGYTACAVNENGSFEHVASICACSMNDAMDALVAGGYKVVDYSVTGNRIIVSKNRDGAGMTPQDMFAKMSPPYLVYEISELLDSGVTVGDIARLIEARNPDYKFSRTEQAYESCILAWFEQR